MNEWRLLEFQTCNAFMNMAIDEAILTARTRELVPNTLRLYGWNPSAVSIGRFQRIENEVQLQNCRKQGVDVVRRMSGGGAVYHDSENEITFCVVAKTKELATTNVASVYIKVYSGIVEALKTLGINADFREGDTKNCPNLAVKGKKISGSSQANKRGCFLHHGTLLLDANLDRMFTFLRVPWAKSRAAVVNVAKNKITFLRAELGTGIPTSKVNDALIKGFEKALKITLLPADLTDFEKELAGKLCKDKYSNENWNKTGKSVLA